MRLALIALLTIGLAGACPPTARADVIQCGGDEPFGTTLTCATTGPASIDGYAFVGDGSSSAQLQWRGLTNASAPGTLELSYTYDGIYNTLFSKIGIRLTVNQPTCDDPHESHRDWVDTSSWDGVPKQIAVPVTCAGPVSYTITSRAATYSPAGSFIGQLTLNALVVHSP